MQIEFITTKGVSMMPLLTAPTAAASIDKVNVIINIFIQELVISISKLIGVIKYFRQDSPKRLNTASTNQWSTDPIKLTNWLPRYKPNEKKNTWNKPLKSINKAIGKFFCLPNMTLSIVNVDAKKYGLINIWTF